MWELNPRLSEKKVPVAPTAHHYVRWAAVQPTKNDTQFDLGNPGWGIGGTESSTPHSSPDHVTAQSVRSQLRLGWR